MSEPIRLRCVWCRSLLSRVNPTRFCDESCAESFAEDYWRRFALRRASAASAAGGRSETTGTSSLTLSEGKPSGFLGSKPR